MARDGESLGARRDDPAGPRRQVDERQTFGPLQAAVLNQWKVEERRR